MVRFVRVQLAAATSPFPLLAAFGTVTWGERSDAKTRVTGINLAAGIGAWAIGFQAWEGTREKSAATTNSRWDASSFGFTGREHELDSGLTYHRDRYMQAAFGRWTQADRMRFVDGPNVYAYASLNPALFTDATGRFTSFTIGILRAVAYTEGAALMVLGARDVALGIASALRENHLDEVAELYIDYGAHLMAIGALLITLAGAARCEQESAYVNEIIDQAAGNVGNGPGRGLQPRMSRPLAERIGQQWVGPGAKPSRSGVAVRSPDGLRQYRLQYKTGDNVTRMNLEWWEKPGGPPIGNFHIDIIE